ncbi:MAG: Thiol-disulfide oxidoreductase ResA [candidate division BRC1 bacterium ADurb.BinA364]|nr:MAG: Thiol-disulfide oxidoreductase ResA [candidate division BRC1 bacterium ADurb.BinA364]
MARMTKIGIAALALALACGAHRAAAAESGGDARALLQKAYAAASGAQSIHLKGATKIAIAGGKTVRESESEIWIAPPNRIKFVEKGAESVEVVADGASLLMASPQYKEYRIEPESDPLKKILLTQNRPLYALAARKPLAPAPLEPVLAGTARIGGQDAVIVELLLLAPAMDLQRIALYLRPADGALLGSDERVGMSGGVVEIERRYTVSELNAPLPAGVFSLNPPKGYSLAGGAEEAPSPFIGQTVQDFPMQPLKGGAPAKLSAFRGSPVILDVWATWCPPCRAAMPYLSQAAQQGARQGLKVVCLSDEDAETVGAYLKDNPFPGIEFYLDPSNKVADLYRIEGIPTTFAIDAQGVIRAVETGFGGPAKLAALIAKIGVAIDLAPADPAEAVLDQAMMDFLIGDREAALAQLTRLAGEKPDDERLRDLCLAAMAATGKKAEAAALLAGWKKRAQGDPRLMNTVAYLMADFDIDLDAAEAMAREALKQLDEPPSWDTLGWILVRKGLFREALPWLERASKEGAAIGVVWYHLGRAYEGLGDTAAAKSAYQKSLGLPGTPIADAQARLRSLQ